jgi:hypothetical protein
MQCYRDHAFPKKKDQCVTVKAEKRRLISLFCVSVYSMKWFSGVKSSVHEIGSVGINVLADDETITLQEPVTYQVRLSQVKLSLCKP